MLYIISINDYEVNIKFKYKNSTQKMHEKKKKVEITIKFGTLFNLI